MKNLAKVVVVVLILGIVFSCFAGCNDDETASYDPEIRPLTMSIGALDGNYNPFFYTAQNDGTVVSMTQVSMLASDRDGNPAIGENRPTVVKDYTVEEKDGGTVYEFLIKNGMKYSDGNDLTIMDVLFNFYVYLDEAYIGSNTLYSTDIKGLKAYQAQDATLSDDSTSSTLDTFLTNAYARINNVVEYCEEGYLGDGEEQAIKDIITIINLFKNEVKSDWTNAENSFNSRDLDTYEYRFTEAWQEYLYAEGIVTKQEAVQNANGAYVDPKDENGKYLTILDNEDTTPGFSDTLQEYVDDYVSEERISAYISANQGATRENAIEALKKEWAIDTVFYTKTGFASVNDTITTLDGTNWSETGVAEIAQFWATGSTALEQFTSEERTKYYEDRLEGGQLAVETISGINAYRTNEFNGKNLDGDYDVLKVEINGIDPKAIWNFAITVAPMHYYSTQALVVAAEQDYAAYIAAYEAGQPYTLTKFGVKFADAGFFGDDGLQAGDKNRLPLGAGAYKASSINGGSTSAGQFHANKFVYYERNEYFNTMGANLTNAVIKYVRYSEIGDDKVITALINEEIDYGMPSGNADNASRIAEKNAYLGSAKYMSNGYGYVGVNPKFVPDVNVRRAIMKAMDTTATVANYYTQEWASVIYRPMSKNSWAYPDGCEEYDSISYTAQQQDIIDLLEAAGYYDTNGDGIREKSGEPLKLTFTIAGSTTDHPAYTMFTEAEKILERCGMDITVATDIQALKKLASGNLAVWAAAWSSSIDPDMYQVYHKDSKATSVKNWNYPGILADQETFSHEYNIIENLSIVIDQARETNNQSQRTMLYSQALDLVMDLAVELPTYQRYDYEVYNKKVINSDSLTKNPAAYAPLFDRLWEVSYN